MNAQAAAAFAINSHRIYSFNQIIHYWSICPCMHIRSHVDFNSVILFYHWKKNLKHIDDIMIKNVLYLFGVNIKTG